MKNLSVYITIAIVGFVLWRNYGVVPTNSKVLTSPFGSDSENTNEQKELKKAISIIYKGNLPNDGDRIDTSFGKNVFNSSYWVKDKEIWQ
jgi:hypothetical protein